MSGQRMNKQRAEKKKSDPLPSSERGDAESLDIQIENSPAEILYLQRTIGNQATSRLLQARRASVIQRDGTEDDPAPAPEQPVMPVASPRGPVMIPGDPGATKMERGKGVVMSALGAHKIEKDVGLIRGQNAAKMVKNAHSHYAQSPSSTVVPDPDGTKTSALFAPLHAVGAQVKTFAVGAADKVVGWLHPLLAFLDSVPGASIFVSLLTTGKAAHSAYKRRNSFFEALKAARIRGDESRVPTKADMEMQQASKYAYYKTNRAFWGNVGRFFASLVKYIMRLTTILTGGTSALGTETVALVVDIAQAVESFVRRLKGVIKSLLGRRGKHRRENAATVYKHALDGDSIALNLLLELKPFGTWDKLKSKLPRTASLPKTESQMLAYLQAHDKPSEEKAMIMEIATKMKST